MLLAVYGSLKMGFCNHIYLRKGTYLGNHLTEPVYTMYSFGGFPAVTKGGSTPIHCEIWQIDDEAAIAKLHLLEGYTGRPGHPNNYYDLTVIDTPFGKADMFYMPHKPKGKSTVPSGIWLESIYKRHQ